MTSVISRNVSQSKNM